MSEAWNKERNEFFWRNLNPMNNFSLPFLADKVLECGSVFSRRRCQRKLQRDLNLSHLHSSRGLAAFVIFVYNRGRQISPTTQATPTELWRDRWHSWSFAAASSYVQLFKSQSYFNTAKISLLRGFCCVVTLRSSSDKNGCVEKDYARISNDESVLCGD